YTLETRTIVVESKTITERLEKPVQLQVTGKVVDHDGHPLVGVSVKIKETNQGTVTDQQGDYTLVLPRADAVLVFSYVGYETKELAATGNTLQVTLESVAQNLEDVVVVGYGVQKKINVTGSVASVNMA